MNKLEYFRQDNKGTVDKFKQVQTSCLDQRGGNSKQDNSFEVSDENGVKVSYLGRLIVE